MPKSCRNSRAIAVFIDNNSAQISLFRNFIASADYINIKNTDILAFHSPEVDMSEFPIRLNHSCIVKYIPYLYEGACASKYPFIKSLSAISDNRQTIIQYDLILKSDVDVFLTPKWNNYYPKLFTVGRGAYCNQIVRDKIKKFHKDHNIDQREDYIDNIGSTWYGASNLIYDVAKLSTKLTEQIFAEFENDEGRWPNWYRGVTSMYASEIAVNKLVAKFIIDADNLDFKSSSDDDPNLHAHIHCWHTDEPFSKFNFLNHKYDNSIKGNLNLKKIKDYCMYIAIHHEIKVYRTSSPIYIVCSPPRSGTSSICQMADIVGEKSMHVLSSHTLQDAIDNGYNFFADTPFYSPEFLLGLFQIKNYHIKLIYIDRDIDTLLQSMGNYGSLNYLKKYSSYDNHTYLHDSVCYWNLTNNSEYIKNHKQIITDIANIYNIPILFYNFQNGWKPFCDFLNVDIPDNISIPHLHKSN